MYSNVDSFTRRRNKDQHMNIFNSRFALLILSGAILNITGCATTESCYTSADRKEAQKKKYGNQSAALLIRNLKGGTPEQKLATAQEGLTLKGINDATRGEFLWAIGNAYKDMGQEEKGRTYQMRVINEELFRYPGQENALKYELVRRGENYDSYRGFTESETAREAQPLVRIPPSMPRNVSSSGHCELQFDVTEAGNPVNIKSIYCTDPVYRNTVIKSAQKWKYNPRVIDGKAEYAENITAKVSMQVRDECGWTIPEP